MGWFSSIIFKSIETEDGTCLIKVRICDNIHYMDMYITPEFIEDSQVNIFSYLKGHFTESVKILEGK